MPYAQTFANYFCKKSSEREDPIGLGSIASRCCELSRLFLHCVSPLLTAATRWREHCAVIRP